MAATGTEAVKLSQLKTALDGKVSTPASGAGTSGQVLSSTGTGTAWIDLPEGAAYQGTAPINVSGTTISVAAAGDGTPGVVTFASDSDASAYLAG